MTNELDTIANTALAIMADVRDTDPKQTLRTLATMAHDEPVYFAQVCMALAVWVGNPTTGELQARAAGAAVGRSAA